MADLGGKNAQGLRGFPTPNETGIAGAYLLFLFGDNPAIAQTILGALEPLVYPDNWYLWGDMSTDAAAEYMREVIEQAPYNVQSTEIQAPFWDEDSGNDADDQAPPDTQDWYGTWDGETFTESLAYVFLTNFLSTLISTGAAIKFLTIPRAFRVAIRQNPHGANLLLFLDGGLYKVINGYSPVDKVAEFIIASPGTELLLVQDSTHDPDSTPDENGNYVVDVIRKRLSADEVLPPNIRWTDTDPPVFQTTQDGGTTWTDNPDADPRYNPQGKLPGLTPYSGVECDAAARMTAQLKATIDIFIATGDATQFATEVIALIVFPFGWAGWFLDLLLLVFNALIDIGQANIESAFTTAVYDDIQCTFSCFVNDDGTIDQSSLDAAYNKIKADHSGTVSGTIDEIRFFYGDVAMSNAGVARDETGDCSGCDSCEWFVEFDFTSGNVHGWRLYTDTSLGAYGAFTGLSFQAQKLPPWECFLWLEMHDLALTGASFYGQMLHGTGIGNNTRFWDITAPGDPPSISLNSTAGLPSAPTLDWYLLGVVASPTQGMGWQFICDNNNTGSIRIDKIRLSGTGTPPPTGVRVGELIP